MVFSLSFALELDENMRLSDGGKRKKMGSPQGPAAGAAGAGPQGRGRRGDAAGALPQGPCLAACSVVLAVHGVSATEEHPLPSPSEDLPCQP